MKHALLLAIWVLLGLSGFHDPAAAREKSIEEITILLEDEKRELQRLKERIEKQNRRISSAGKREVSLLRTLNRMETQVKLKERELEIYKWNIEINKRKVIKLTRNITKAQNSLSRQKSVLAKWLRIIYKDGGLYPVKVLFSADSVTDMVRRMKYMEVVTEYDTALFRQYADKLENLNKEKETLLDVRSELLRLQKDAAKKKSEIKPRRLAKIKFLRRLKKDKVLFVKAQKEYTQRSSALKDLILRLEKKRKHGENLNFADHKGRLDLPVDGKILNRFGRKKDKQYDVYIVHNGINIRTNKGTPVRVVYSGKVLYIGSLAGYGNLVIIGHGENYHSVYGHMGRIFTKVGKNVRRGQILGKSGDSGSIIGAALYFELRHNGKAIDPATWFRLAKN
ncbi:MAG: murein hydrolase activator EnvC family protein [Nitrospinales bacterium]